MATRLPRLFLAAVVCASLAGLIVYTAVVEVALRSGATGKLPPIFDFAPRIALAAAMSELQKTGGELNPAVIQQVYEAADEAPLAEEPYVVGGIDSLLRGNDKRAERLLEIARRRNPRSRVTRLLLLDLYGRTGRVRDAAAEMMVLSRLLDGASGHLVPALVQMAQSPEGRLAVADALQQDLRFRADLLSHLVQKGADPALILTLAGDQSRRRGDEPFEAWQEQLVRTAAERGDLKTARALWVRFSGVSPAETALVDGDFRQLDLLPPFSWKLIQSAQGAAEPAVNGGIEVVFYGREDAILAEQLLLLSPGLRYRLTFHASSRGNSPGESLAWTIACARDKDILVTVPVRNQLGGGRTASADFVVPTACGSQWLQLKGNAGEFQREQRAFIRQMRIQRIGT